MLRHMARGVEQEEVGALSMTGKAHSSSGTKSCQSQGAERRMEWLVQSSDEVHGSVR